MAPENLDKWAISELKAARFPEGREHTYERAFVLKEFLARYKKTNNIKGKIAVVTHTNMICAMTAKKFSSKNRNGFVNPTYASNGQIIPIQLWAQPYHRDKNLSI